MSTWPEGAGTWRRVLEVACGTGYWTQFIALQAESIVAADILAEPLEFARLRPHTDSVRFLQADAYAPPPDPGPFDGAFAGLWFSHVPVGARAAFFAALHVRLVPGARVVLLDNSEVQCRELPIVERDDQGNTYQLRELKDGTRHRVLKNFPSGSELLALVAEFSVASSFQRLENFWLLEYELAVRSTDNLEDAKVLLAGYLNIRDLFTYDKLVLSVKTLDTLAATSG